MTQRPDMPSVLDREVDSPAADAFGHRHYAEALRSLLESESNRPPFSIGLLGGWGTGKSTIKQIFVTSLANDRTKDASGILRAEKVQVITFNAWRFGGEDIKRSLLRHVFLALGGDETRLNRELFTEVTRQVSVPRSRTEIRLEYAEKRFLPILYIALLLAMVVAAVWTTKRLLGITDNTWLGAITLAYTTVLPFLIDKIVKFEPIQRSSSFTALELPRATAEQFEELLIGQIKEFKKGHVLGGKGKKCERLIVFVDDLDRLSAEEMVSGLDAIRTFMEIPENCLPKGLGIVFVISCDEERVAQALATGKRRSASPELPGSVFTRSDARRFLDRIFQYRLEIPRFPKRDMRTFVLSKLESLDGIAEDLRARGVSLEVLVDRMIHVGVQSPRNALQILNAFAQSWWLARTRESEAAGTDRPGGLHEGAVTKHPYTLGAISALRVDFPEFFADLQVEPELIRRLADVVLRGLPFQDVPQATQETLSKYLNEQRNDVRGEYRPLRQYIASLQTLRWPSSLQPLLILTQDPVTRRYGDRAPRLFESLVSGDVNGVLEELGRE